MKIDMLARIGETEASLSIGEPIVLSFHSYIVTKQCTANSRCHLQQLPRFSTLHRKYRLKNFKNQATVQTVARNVFCVT